MSVGNLKDNGNKGNNFPWQLAVLKLLDQVANNTSVLGPDYETRTTTFEALAGSPTFPATGYAPGDILVRYDIISTVTGAIIQTIWFNQTAQTTLPSGSPDPTDLIPIAGSSSVTVINGPGGAAVNIQDGGNSITIDAASLPLPTGAATAALQTQPGVDIGDVTVNNAGGASAVNIQDGGNSITIDATSLPLPTGAATETTVAAIDTKLAPVVRTPSLLRTTTATGPVAAGANSVTIANTGNLTGTVLGTTLQRGESVTFSAGLNNTLGAISYDPTTPGSTEFLIAVTL